MSDSRLALQIRAAHAAAIAAGLTISAGEAFHRALALEMKREPTPEEMERLLLTWALIARPEQLAPPSTGEWDTWLLLAGRGFGKTRSGAEATCEQAESRRIRIALVAPTAADARDVMVEGDSGIKSLYAHRPMRERPKYEPSKRRITWPNGSIATLFSAEKPDRLRGPQHHWFWADELAAWDDPQGAWDQLQFGMRLGEHPRGVVTTTPRPLPLIKALIADPRVAVTRGSTYDNQQNLPSKFLRAIFGAYEGTRLGRQELNAEILDDNPNALWQQALIDLLRVRTLPIAFRRVVIGVDPAVTSNPNSDLTGIVAAGALPECRALATCNGKEEHAFVLDDVSGIYTPMEWAEKTTLVYTTRHADKVIGETNNGGDLVESNLRAYGDRNISFKKVTASRGKEIRAEPVAGLYEQKKVHHYGTHAKLEDEQTQWDPKAKMKSPSRLDALVWALTELMIDGSGPIVFPTGFRSPQRRI